MARKKRLGRPRKEDPRNIVIAVRITAKEKAALVRAAKRADMSLSAYVMAPHREGP